MSVVSGIDLSGTKINGQSGAVCAAAGKREDRQADCFHNQIIGPERVAQPITSDPLL
jgi:hypothetical protein